MPEETRFARVEFRDPGSTQTEVRPVTTLQQERRPQRYPAIVQPVVTLGRVGISMAGGEEGSELEYWPKLIDEMLTKKSGGKFQVVRYRNKRHGARSTQQLIRDLAESDLLIAVISNKYLSSAYCMAELLLAARHWSTARNDDQRSKPGFVGESHEWLPRIMFFILKDAEHVCASDESAVQRQGQWSGNWYEYGVKYCDLLKTKFRDNRRAQEEGAKANAYDAWMRFVAEGDGQAVSFLHAIRHSVDRIALSLSDCPAGVNRDEWARCGIEAYIDDTLLHEISKKIEGMQTGQRIKRCVDIAMREFYAGDFTRFFELVNHCLEQYQNPKDMTQQLKDGQTIPAELEPLKPSLPAWRANQGLPKKS